MAKDNGGLRLRPLRAAPVAGLRAVLVSGPRLRPARLARPAGSGRFTLRARGPPVNFQHSKSPTFRPGTGTMNTSAAITFVVIAGLVWGGFLFIVAKAVGKERRKAHHR
jgi:hypothetical protein